MSLEIINPITYPNWDDILLTHEDSTFFHSSSWARVLSESYNYKPLYFASINNGKLEILVPIMEVNSLLTGKRGVSLPFTDYCQPIVGDSASFTQANSEVINFGKEARWRYIEWRDGAHLFRDETPSLSFYSHVLTLEKDENSVISKFRDSTRRNIRKAQRQGVQVGIHQSQESVRQYFQLNCKTRKMHGLPPQPFSFFRKIYQHITSKKKGVIVLASFNKKIIAGSINFHFGNKAIFKYGASDTRYLYLRPNNIVMWEAIKWYMQNGYKHFHFGITELRNLGLARFKRGWGTREKMINYYKYHLIKDKFVKDSFRGKTSYLFFQKMPAFLLNITGSLLYRHFA